jgi:hypothetical protein
MSTLQRDELLTILERETSPPAKEADQDFERSPAKRSMGRIYNRMDDLHGRLSPARTCPGVIAYPMRDFGR